MENLNKCSSRLQYSIIKEKQTIVVIYLSTITAYLLYILIGSRNNIELINIFIFSFSIALVFEGIKSISIVGLKISNTFLVSFFSVLSLNNINISALQKPKTFSDLYFFFVGPIIFYLILISFEKYPLKINVKKLCKCNINVISSVLLALYCIGYGYLFMKTGIRFFSDQWSSQYSSMYVIPGISGILAILSWTLVMIIPNVNRTHKIIIIILTLTVSLLSAKRGDGMRLLAFVIIMIGYNYGNKFFKLKNLRYIIIGGILIIVLFSIWGNYRQEKRGWTDSMAIGMFLESNIDNDIINWIYGYTGINFDVLKQEYIEKPSSGEFKEIFLPIIRLFGGNEAIEEYYNNLNSHGLRGFNAATFLSGFVRESGWMYFIGVAILGSIVGFLGRLCKVVKFNGGYIMLLMITSITFFGNYYLNANYFFSLVLCIGIHLFIDFEKENKL